MKSIIFIGIILLAVGGLLFYLDAQKITLQVLYGALSGVGIGLIFGGLVGYISKGQSIKESAKSQELKKLKKAVQEQSKDNQDNNSGYIV